jgi:hypothetical protein
MIYYIIFKGLSGFALLYQYSCADPTKPDFYFNYKVSIVPDLSVDA